MVVQHNIGALTAYRNLGINQGGLNGNLEKLSSGYRINRAGDDAAGLAISENMRAQIRGLNQAARNAQEAVGLIKTAEGGLTEIHAMLQRMTTLATQGANGTYNSVAQKNIQAEVDELLEEIDRISANTNFNGVYTLKGAASTQLQIGTTAPEIMTVEARDMSSAILGGSLNVTGVSAANAAMSTIRTAINTVSEFRAELGAKQDRLEFTYNNLYVTAENLTDAESRIRDTDMPEEITAFTSITVYAGTGKCSAAERIKPSAVMQCKQRL